MEGITVLSLFDGISCGMIALERARIKVDKKSNWKAFKCKDLKALEAYCTNYAKWQKCEQIIDEKGYSMEVGDNGYEQQRPEVSIANKAQTEMRAWAKELGLTPAARQRMKAESAQGDGGIDAELDGMIAHD